MFLPKYFIQVTCLIALAMATPLGFVGMTAHQEPSSSLQHPAIGHAPDILSRKVRSPDGSIDLTYKNDRGGREASVQYNQNLYKSGDGRVNVDAYAHGTRNFDYNRNDYGGGIRGSIRF